MFIRTEASWPLASKPVVMLLLSNGDEYNIHVHNQHLEFTLYGFGDPLVFIRCSDKQSRCRLFKNHYIASQLNIPVFHLRRSYLFGRHEFLLKDVWLPVPNAFFPSVTELGFRANIPSLLIGNEVQAEFSDQADRMVCVMLTCVLWARKWVEG